MRERQQGGERSEKRKRLVANLDKLHLYSKGKVFRAFSSHPAPKSLLQKVGSKGGGGLLLGRVCNFLACLLL